MVALTPTSADSSSAAEQKTVGFINFKPYYHDEITRTKNVKSMELTGLVSKCDILFGTLIIDPTEEIAWEFELSRHLFISWKDHAGQLSLSLSMGNWMIVALRELELWLTKLESLILQGSESDIRNEDTNFMFEGNICKPDEKRREYLAKRKRAGVGWSLMCAIAMKSTSKACSTQSKDCIYQIDQIIVTLQQKMDGRGRRYILMENEKAEKKASKIARKEERKKERKGKPGKSLY
ncbi:hypothetical protein E2P81_ATG02738 [Venturia nashicola]|nr:hypothetical protein E2P81_ATG02738 [Venturia nashicola]